MNIATGLREIKRVKGEIARWTARFAQSNVFSDNEPRAYVSDEAAERLTILRQEIVRLKSQVAIANATNSISIGGARITLAEAIFRLAEIKGSITMYSTMPALAAPTTVTTTERYTSDGIQDVEVTQYCTYTIRQKDELVLELENRFRELNAVLEAANHRIEI